MEWPSEVDRLYVICHPEHEKDRYERLKKHLQDVHIPADRVRIVAPCWGSDLTSDLIFKIWDPFLQRGVPTLTFKGSNLTLGELSLNFNFYYAMKAAIEENTKVVITIESDVFLRADFIQRLHDLLADLKEKEWDYVSLGEGIGTRAPGAPSSYYSETKAYKPPHELVFRCTDSMMFRTDFLKSIIQTYIPFREIIDWEMNYQNMLHKGKTYWADPPLAEQGTCFGRMVSSLPA